MLIKAIEKTWEKSEHECLHAAAANEVKGGSHLLEWVTLVRFLDGLENALVYPEGDGDREEGKSHVGEHTDDAAHGQGEQKQ